MDKSPFSYSDKVISSLFLGRKALLEKLQNNIFACHATTIYGDRRVGKSSLILESIRLYKKNNKKSKHLFLLLDMSLCLNPQDFVKHCCEQINKLIKENKPIVHKVKELTNLIRSIRLSGKVNSITGELEHSFDFSGELKDINLTIEDIFDLLESLTDKEQKLTVVFDEFQSIVNWNDSDKFQWQIRSRVQKSNNIGYIFSGSSRKLIKKLFTESQSAFYQSGSMIFVENFLDELQLAPWIKKQFASASMKISGEAIKKIIDVARLHPYYTQKLCYEVWNEKRYSSEEIELGDVEKVILYIIATERIIFQERLDRLTINQKNVVKTISKIEKNETIFSQSVVRAYSLPSPSSIKAALQSLENEVNPLIFKENGSEYHIEDPFFELWLKNN